MSRQFEIQGGKPLAGSYPVQGNKNAALPLICASLLVPGRYAFTRVPQILDVRRLVELTGALGVKTQWRSDRLEMDTSTLRWGKLPEETVEQLRGAVLLLGAVAERFEAVRSPLPGGCPIGRRSFDVHWRVFESAGFSVQESDREVRLKKQKKPARPEIFLEESSVTATENALLLYAACGAGKIYNPAREPHIFSLIQFLERIGCRIDAHPLYFEVRQGAQSRQDPVEFEVPPDLVDAGTIAAATGACGGSVVLQGVTRPDLLGIEPILAKFGIDFQWKTDSVVSVESSGGSNPTKVTAGPWPLFPTDLVSLAVVLATQKKGLCLVHDWMYESRMFFVDKLIRMGARITMCDPHRVLVEGPSSLRGTRLESPDIRAGMALVVAGLCAQGTTCIEHAEVIMRGYEQIIERFEGIGASIRERL